MARGGRERKRPREANSSSSSEEIPVQNRFNVLGQVNNVQVEEMISSVSQNSKPPPIIIDGQLKDHTKTVTDLKTKLKEDFSIKVSRAGKTVLRVKSSEDHRIAMSYLEEAYEFHSFSLKEDFQPNWVLSGLPRSVTTDEIQAELLTRGLQVIKIRCISKHASEYPLYSIIFEKATMNTKILTIKRLCYCVVSWSKYKNKTEITQCYRCMLFGHIGKNCRRKEKCVKCGGEHPIKDCTVDTVSCSNCGEAHRANEKSCNAYKKNLEMKNKKKQIFFSTPRRSQQVFSEAANSRQRDVSSHAPSQPGFNGISVSGQGGRSSRTVIQEPQTWSQVLGRKSQPSTSKKESNPSMNTEQNEMKSGTFSEIKDILNIINIPKIMLFLKFIGTKLKETEDTFSKIVIVIEGLFQFFDL